MTIKSRIFLDSCLFPPTLNPNLREWHIKLKKGLIQSEKHKTMRQYFIPNKLSKIKIPEKYHVDYVQ